MLKLNKILFVSTVPFAINGMSTVIINLLNQLDLNNKQVDIAFNGLMDESYKNLINTKYKGKINIYELPNRKKFFLKYCIDLFRLLKKNKYKFFYIHGNSSTMFIEAFIGKLLKSTILVHTHSASTNHYLINRFLQLPLAIVSDYAIAVSNEAGKANFGSRQFIVLPNGINIEGFRFNQSSRDSVRRMFGFQKDDIVILFVGRLSKEKNPAFIFKCFLEAKKQNRKLKLLFLGNGSEKEYLEHLISKYEVGDSVKIKNSVLNVEAFYSCADCCAFPSSSEGFGLTALEAQCSGAKVLISNGFPKIVNLKNDIFEIPISDEKEWINQLKKTRNKVKNRNLGYKNLQDSQFDIKIQGNVIERIVDHYYE